MRKMFSESQINKIAKSSGSAANGQVLTADGNGGSSWQAGGTQLYKHSIVYGPITRIIISTTSTAYTALSQIIADYKAGNILSCRYNGIPNPDFTAPVYIQIDYSVLHDAILKGTGLWATEISSTATIIDTWSSFSGYTDTVTAL